MTADALSFLRRASRYGMWAALSLVFAAGCWGSKPAPTPPMDDSLRVFLGIKSLSAKVKVPEGEDFFTFHVLNFHEGKLVDNAICMPSKIAGGNAREMNMELLWGEQRGETVVTVFLTSADSHGWSRQSGNTAKYWQSFDRANGQTINPAQPVEHLGYKILAFVQSSSGQRKPAAATFEEALLQERYVGAIAVKTYGSQEAMDKVVHAGHGPVRY